MKIERGMAAVVTGAGSGFGRACSLALAKRGVRVVVSDLDLDRARETAELIAAAGGEAQTVRCDVGQAEQVEDLARFAERAYGHTDVLVNNAGLAVAGRIGEIPLEDWKLEVDVNLMGVIYGCHYFVPKMRARKRGAVLNVASAAGLLSAAMMGPYNVTKAGVIALSETLATEVHGDGIAVTALCPTFFQTQIHLATRAPDALKKATERLITKSSWSADRVAEAALRGLERGELYVIPQLDGKLAWRLKRVIGAAFYGGLSAKLQARISGS